MECIEGDSPAKFPKLSVILNLKHERRQLTAMDTKYSIINYNRKGQEVEHIRKVCPHM